MTNLEAIVEQAKRLSADERDRLLRMLAEQVFAEGTDSEAAVGQRGLHAWTESVGAEDWSRFYPETVRNNGRPTT